MSTTELYKSIQINIQKERVYLHNKRAEKIDELIYETASMFTADDTIAVSSTPKYQIKDIPPKSAVLLEILDGWEDGKPRYYLTKIKTKTIDIEVSVDLRIKHLSGFSTLPQIANCEITKLGTKDGFIVNIKEESD